MFLKKLNKQTFLIILLFVLIITFLWFWTRPKLNTQTTIKIYDQNNQLLYQATNKISSQQSISLPKIPLTMQQSVVLAEDKRFFKHSGIDLISLIRAFKENLQAGKIVSGGSTITQQLARFTTITPYQPAKVSYLRKFRESLIALRISATNSKNAVLEKYLNIMHWGRNTYGVQAASKLYFNKTVSQLSLAECALLAGMIPNPAKYDPITHPKAAKQVRSKILKLLLNNQIITKEEFKRAATEPLPRKTYQSTIQAPHSVAYILKKVKELKIKTNQGLSIYTTINLDLQKDILEIARNQVDELAEKHRINNSAVVVLDNKTNNIETMVGGINYFDKSIGGQNNLATSLRQPGSTLKPITYALAFEQDSTTPATVIKDYPKVYQTESGEGYQPRNYDEQYHGPVLVREALASSYNLPAVEMLKQVGIKNFLELCHKMGITTMKETDRYGLAITLGGGEVKLLDLTNVYATLAKKGAYQKPRIIKTIKNHKNKVIYRAPKQIKKQVISPQTAWLITDILKDPKARMPAFGEKNPLVLTKPAAVKTGTTTDWHDNWTIGYTKNYTVGVWVGNTNNQPMKRISGITGASPIWKKTFQKIFKFSNYQEFEQPPKIISKQICKWDGLLATNNCTEQYTEYFIKGTAPKEHTKLVQKPVNTFYLDSEVQIINPKQDYQYQIGADEQAELVFKISPNLRVEEVTWFINNNKIIHPQCNQTCAWQAKPGNHKVSALVYFQNNTQKKLPDVSFSVSKYRENW